MIDLAVSRQRELWDEPSVADFSEDAVPNLGRKGFPFAPLLTLVRVEGLRPSPVDSFFAQIQGETRESLARRMEALKLRTIEVVKELAAFDKSGASGPDLAEDRELPVSIAIFH